MYTVSHRVVFSAVLLQAVESLRWLVRLFGGVIGHFSSALREKMENYQVVESEAPYILVGLEKYMLSNLSRTMRIEGPTSTIQIRFR